MDIDLEQLSRDELIAEVERLRTGIRAHRTAPDMIYAGIILSSGDCCRNRCHLTSPSRRGPNS